MFRRVNFILGKRPAGGPSVYCSCSQNRTWGGSWSLCWPFRTGAEPTLLRFWAEPSPCRITGWAHVSAQLSLGTEAGPEFLCGIFGGLWVSGEGAGWSKTSVLSAGADRSSSAGGFPTILGVPQVCEIEMETLAFEN